MLETDDLEMIKLAEFGVYLGLELARSITRKNEVNTEASIG
ncbi:hypothetical protein PPTG_21271 [Phytophthora nicotianae INRA-310]|uniref:Uncharacterized protein n=1 Tax=Phytophthora nicotianae (strain INRA-310) TaxID=761204 RepID=W2R6I1_PHYN3|nr:hypothetical protein PPTG_21271 [Phytophthora nicotianae INRA-310]ETN20299.1 hypothetical protein PPTG_21271 [Phytophthora nicotianae INRA-310]